MRGKATIKIGGEDRPVKFGTNQSAKYCEIRGLSLQESRDEFINLFIYDKDGKEIIGSNETGSEIRDLIFSGLWAGAITEGKTIDFNQFKVGDWIDEMEQEELNSVFSALINNNDSGSKGGSEDDEKKS